MKRAKISIAGLGFLTVLATVVSAIWGATIITMILLAVVELITLTSWWNLLATNESLIRINDDLFDTNETVRKTNDALTVALYESKTTP